MLDDDTPAQPLEPTKSADLAPATTCSYCEQEFTESDCTLLTTHTGTRELVRCAGCRGVHVLLRTNTLQHGWLCPGATIAHTEPHPTDDNTPWGTPACRHCTTFDPFTHLQGFVAGVLGTAAQRLEQIATLQAHNDALLRRNAELLRINSDVHLAAAAVYNALRTFPAEAQANAFGDEISCTQRYHGEILLGKETYNTLMEFGRVSFLRGVRALRAALPLEPGTRR